VEADVAVNAAMEESLKRIRNSIRTKAAFTGATCCSGATVNDERQKRQRGAVVPLAKEMQGL
jgi:hypothetical protein